jgi:S-adenosylmethionine hydrolase
MNPLPIPVISLTTDFGSQDGFVGTLKGAIWSICPAAQIADISHAITPQNVLQGALTLGRAYPFFPNGTVHVAVVDPGVGTSRRPIAACLGKHFFVGPDNGLFTPAFEQAEKNGWPLEVVHLTNERFWLPAVSHTFHGRDIFAPVAAHLARGVPFTDLGPALSDPVRIALPKPEKIPGGWRAHVTIVDIFGNCTLDLPAAFLAGRPDPLFRLRGREVRGLVDSYGHRQSGELIALVDSENYIEIALVNGSAAALTGARVGDEVEVVE